MYQQPGVILLREGTDTSQGKAQLISNINACMVRAPPPGSHPAPLPAAMMQIWVWCKDETP